MKKILLLISLLFMFLTVDVYAVDKPEVTDHEVVKIYMFWEDGCGYCENAINLFNDLEDEYAEYFEVIGIDVYDGSNNTLFSDIQSMLGETTGVPYFVIGEEIIKGYSESGIISLALEQYQNDDYKDVVGPYAEAKTGYALASLEEVCKAKGINYWNATKVENPNDAIIVAGIFIILIGGMGYLVFAPKKK